MSIQSARDHYDTLVARYANGDPDVTLLDLQKAQHDLRVLIADELVDDPYQPGRKVRPSLAHVDPSLRFQAAFTAAYVKEDS